MEVKPDQAVFGTPKGVKMHGKRKLEKLTGSRCDFSYYNRTVYKMQVVKTG